MNILAYPALRKAIVEIAYDNGCVNRFSTEDEVVQNACDALVVEYTLDQLKEVNDHLATLTDEDLNELCAGEHQEPVGDLAVLVDNVLNCAFDNLL